MTTTISTGGNHFFDLNHPKVLKALQCQKLSPFLSAATALPSVDPLYRFGIVVRLTVIGISYLCITSWNHILLH